ncbi:MAG: right-handed parallel beta-helix repeat-containing protein [Deltaproteobacteria bacterium]|nr:right-handed parallel beta-helix repeat-containing protein [Deltaproteobacteria bacterium]
MGKHTLLSMIVFLAVVLLPLKYAHGSLPGDCDGDSAVGIGEVQGAINMFLGLKPVLICVDGDDNKTVSIAEVQKSINAFLGLILPQPTPGFPTITLTSPADGAVTAGPRITVNGSVSAGVSTVSVNGIAATLTGDAFTADVPVTTGSNVILISASNAKGLKTTEVRTVRMPHPVRTGGQAAVGIVISGAYCAEGDMLSRTVKLPVRLTQVYAGPVSVNWATSDGTAIAGSDYVAASGSITFLPGETEKFISVQILGDTVAESATEMMYVKLSNPVGAPLATSSATVVIEDDDRTTIGASGGIARLADGAVHLRLHSGGVAGDVAFTAESAAENNPLIQGNSYLLSPASLLFSAQTTLTLRYDPLLLAASLKARDLQIAFWDGTSWQSLAGSTVDAVSGTVSARIISTGKYAVIDGRNTSSNIAYVVNAPAAVNEFATIPDAVAFVCGKPGPGRVIVRRTPLALGRFSPSCPVDLEREDETPVTFDGASNVVSAAPISFTGFNFTGSVNFIAGNHITLRSNQFGGAVNIVLDPSPAGGLAKRVAKTVALPADCTHQGNAGFTGNVSGGPVSLALAANVKHCANISVNDSIAPALSVDGAADAKVVAGAHVAVNGSIIKSVDVKLKAEGDASVSFGELDTETMYNRMSVAAGVTGPRVESVNLNASLSAEVALEGGGSLTVNHKGATIRDEMRFSLLDDRFVGEVHGELGASTLGKLHLDVGGTGLLKVVDGVAVQGGASFEMVAGLKSATVENIDSTYHGDLLLKSGNIPLLEQINFVMTGKKTTDVYGGVSYYGGFGIRGTFKRVSGETVAAAQSGLLFDGFNIVSKGDLATMKNGIHIDADNRSDRIEIKNNTYSVGQATGIFIEKTKGEVLIQGNTILQANTGIMLENISGQTTIDGNTVTSQIGITQGNASQNTIITGNTLNSYMIGLNLSGSSTAGLHRRTAASGNTITMSALPDGDVGMAVMLMSSSILNFNSNLVVGGISVAAIGYDAYATVVGNSIRGSLADNPMSPALVANPIGQGLDAENDIMTIVDFNSNGCADFPPSLDFKDENGVCAGDDGVPPRPVPLI